jgi:hypothetical protein
MDPRSSFTNHSSHLPHHSGWHPLPCPECCTLILRKSPQVSLSCLKPPTTSVCSHLFTSLHPHVPSPRWPVFKPLLQKPLTCRLPGSLLTSLLAFPPVFPVYSPRCYSQSHHFPSWIRLCKLFFLGVLFPGALILLSQHDLLAFLDLNLQGCPRMTLTTRILEIPLASFTGPPVFWSC